MRFRWMLCAKVQDVRKSSLTFAPEAGSQRMRDVINKGLTEEVILKGRSRLLLPADGTESSFILCWAFRQRPRKILRALQIWPNKVAKTFYEIPKGERPGNGRCRIVVSSTSFFVPKPFTPFQWVRQCTDEEFRGETEVLKCQDEGTD